MKKVLLRTICSISFIAVLLSAVSINANTIDVKPVFASINDAILNKKAAVDASFNKPAIIVEKITKDLGENKKDHAESKVEELPVSVDLSAVTGSLTDEESITTSAAFMPFTVTQGAACPYGIATVTYSGNSVQSFTVPAGVFSVTIRAIGASGGAATSGTLTVSGVSNGFSRAGGRGAILKGDFSVTPSENLFIIVGQKGGDETPGFFTGVAGGGGGTFITRTSSAFSSTSDLLIAAGGGGGAGKGLIDVANSYDRDANVTINGNYSQSGTGGALGSGGNGGTNGPANVLIGNTASGGGAGFLTSAINGGGITATSWGGKSPSVGAAGGTKTTNVTSQYGGYGGGGVSDLGGGGGGGYSGGGGATNTNYGGGGGSYINPSAGSVTTQRGVGNLDGTGNGLVVITWPLVLPTISASSNSPLVVGSTLNLTSTSPNTFVSYSWTGPNSFTSSLQNPSILSVTTAASGTYTVTGTDANGCTATASTVVVVNTSCPTPSFSGLSGTLSICTGTSTTITVSSADASPVFNWYDASTGGTLLYTGAAFTTPVLSATTTYYVSVTTCATSARMPVTVTVNPIVTPTFTQVAAICSGASLSALPTTSNNSIVGTWSPALNNTATTTYTFTPNAGQCANTATMTITVNPTNTIAAGVNRTTCINSAITNITLATTGATGATVTGLPAGVTGSWSADVFTISGTPTVSGTFNYTVTTTGGCPGATAGGTITVNALNTIAAGSSQTVCINSAITNITLATTGATGATVTGLPAGVTGSWSADVFTISGTPTVSGTFNYTVTTTGGCPGATAGGTITVNALNTIAAGSSQTVCIGSPLTNITIATTGATGATVTGLPTGVTGTWSANVVTISGTPSVSGTFNYTVTTTGGCPGATAGGTITVNALNTIAAGSNQTVCIGSPLTNITIATTGATGATFTGLPTGVTGTWSGNVVTISGTPSVSGTFNYTVTTTGGCPGATAGGTITVNALNTIAAGSSQTVCINSAITNITLATTGATGATVTGLPAGVTGSWSANVFTISGTPTVAGTFNYTVTTTGGCPGATAGGTITVNNTPTPTITADGPTTFCTGGSVTLTSSSATGNVWSTGATTQSITVSASGSYSVTVTANGCPATSASTTVTVNNTPTPTITADGPTTFCTGGSVTLTSSSATGNVWSTGATTQSITVSASGSYSVTVTANGCPATSASTTVTVNNTPTPTITADGPTTFCTGGSVTLTSSSATGNVWSTGATTQSITVNASGSYSVTVTANGCPATSASTTVTVNNTPTPTITADGPTTFCTGGSVTLTSSSATGNVWSTGATTQSITVSASGSYSVTVTANGCPATSASTTVTVNNTPTPTITADGPTTFCTGGSVTLTSSSATGNVWSTGATTQSITVSASGSYSVTVTANGCPATSASTTVTVNNTPTPTITADGPTTFCTGGSVTLTSSSATGNVWSTGATTQSITVSASGSYSVTVTANGCPATSASTTVTVNNTPTPTITADGPTTFCTGGSVTLTSSSATGNVWSTGATTQSITVSASGSYSVTVTANGCPATSASTTVTVNNTPTPTITADGPTTFCTGGSVTLTSSSATGNVWSTGATTQSITVSASGSYSVTVTANGCPATSASTTVTVNNTPTPTITADGPTTFCTGGSVTLTSSSATGNVWSTGATTQSITVSASGSYSVTVTANGCPATSASTTVTVNNTPTPTITADGPTTFCTGGSVTLTSSSATGNVWSTGATTQSITVSASGSYSVTVTANGCPATSASTTVTVNNTPTPTITADGPTTFCTGGSVTLTSSSATGNVWSTGATTQSITVSASGSYSVTVTANGCPATSASTTVTVNNTPTPTITADGPTTFCTGGSVTLTSSSATGNVWSTGATTQSITVSASGSYSVTVTANGCPATSASTTVTVNNTPTPTITADGPTTFCTGGSVTLTSSSATGNVWSTGATTQSITVNASGSYSVTVTANGCPATSASTTVTVNNTPTPTITADGPTTFCTGGSVTLTSSSATGNVWSTGATTQSITVSASGSYSVTVTANGCPATSASTTVTVNNTPTPTITADGPTTFCTGGSVTLTSSSATGNVWSTGATTQSITVSASGSYSVTVTANGCPATSASTTVTVNNTPTPTITADGPTTFCTGGSVTLTSSSATGNVWSTGATTQSITVSASGSYSVTVTANGCPATSASTTVTVNNTPTPTITADGPTTFCTGGSVTLTSSSATGNVWSTGATTQSITVSASGSYSVTVTANGCPATSAAIVVTVQDIVPPVTPVLPNITGECSATAPLATTSDACAGTITGTTSDPLSYNTQGDHVIHWTFTDPTGNFTTADQHVIIHDVTPPVPVCPANITVTANTTDINGNGGSNVTFTATGTDNCSIPVITYSHASGSFFPIGTTTVTVTATDAVGLTGTCTFDVIVNCVTPVFTTCPAPIVTNTALGICAKVVTYTTAATGVPAASFTYTMTGATTGSGTGDGSGTSFNKGVTTVTVTATNICGTATCTFTVTVEDHENPVIVNLPGTINKTNDAGTCGAVVTWSAVTATDNCPIVTLVSDHNSGDTYPVGTTTVHYTATDASGNTSTGQFNVVVTDTEKPTVTCPSDIVVTANTVVSGNAGYVATYTVTTSDNCGVQSTVYSIPSGSFFPIGTTPVTVTVTDIHGNTKECTFNVIVNCVTPVFTTCPAPIVTNTALGICAKVVTYTTAATGVPAASFSYTMTGATTGSGTGDGSGTSFNKGVTTVTVTATNICGTATCTFTVTVEDHENPVIVNLPGTINKTNDAGTCGAVVTWSAVTATDNCPIVTLVSDHNSGDTYPVGTTTVHYTATDASGNTSTGQFNVVVTDTEKPTVTCPSDIVVTANTVVSGNAGYVATYTVTTSDNCGVQSTVYSIPSGSFFPIGTTPVTVTVTDIHGNTKECTFNVIVNCVTPVFTTCPTPIVTNTALGICAKVVTYTTAATGVPAASFSYTMTGATTGSGTGDGSGTSFNKGVTTVTVTATNICGTATCTFTVTVEDHENPVIVNLPGTINKTNDAGTCGAVVTWSAVTATDNCPIVTLVSDHNSGDTYPVGTTTVHYTATDASGNTSTGQFNVVVTDTEKPTVTCPSDIVVTANTVVSGNAGYVATYTVTTSDNCGVQSTVYSIPSGSFFPIGTTPVTVTVTDIHGNTKECTFNVIVNCVTPVFTTCPTPIVTNTALGICAKVVTYTTAATGVPAASFTYTMTGATTGSGSGDGSGTSFNKGVTTVTVTATNICGTATCTFTVTVEDHENPVIVNLPGTINKTNDAGTCGAVVTWSAVTATDNCPIVTLVSDHNSGDTYPVGTTTVHYTATDASGNTSTGQFNVVVTDTEKPTVTCPSDIVVTANTVVSGNAGYVATYTVTTSDNCGVQSTVYSIPSGSFFPIGTTPVTVTVTDIHGNTKECTFNVIVNCVTPVFTTCPTPIVTNTALGICAKVVTYTTAATGVPAASFSYTMTGATTGSGTGDGSGTSFNKGVTTVTVTATNICGTATCTFTVTVEDHENPVIVNLPGNISKTNDAGVCGAVVTWSAVTATDNCPIVTLVSDHTSGQTYPIGTTTVHYTATDASGNTSTGSFTVTVTDTENPIITMPADVTHTADAGLCSFTFGFIGSTNNDPTPDGPNNNGPGENSVVLGLATATDNCSVTLTSVRSDGQPLGAAYPVGTTTITWTATDAAGHVVTGIQTVTITDDEYPVIHNLPAGFNVNTDAGVCGATVTWPAVTTTDNCAATITSDHHSGDVFPVGTTTVHYTATDIHGHVTNGNFNVTVTDNQAPVIACHANITVPGEPGLNGAHVSYVVTATDNCGTPAITYSVQPGTVFQIGTTAVTVTATDVNGLVSTCTFSVTVTNNPPVANPDVNSTTEDTPVSGNVLPNDTDPDGHGLTVTGFTINSVNYAVGSTATFAEGTLVINANGTYTYTPAPNFYGSVPVATYTITDGHGGTASTTLTIIVTAVNDAPTALPDVETTPEDTPVSGNVLTNDNDLDLDGLTVTSFVVNSISYAPGAHVTLTEGDLVINANGTFTFTPALNYNGPVPVATYFISDGHGGTASSTLTINVTPVNDVPVAVNDAVTTNEDTPVSGTVTGNDTPSGDGGNVWSVVSTTTHGTLVFNPNGTYTYTPNANYNGTDVFTYKVCDVDGDCSTATVTITIVPVNDVPVAVNDAVTTNEDTPVSGTVTGNDTPSGDGGNVWSVVSTTTHGTLVFNPNGTYTYTPNANYNGTDVFTYKVCDVDGDCSTATVTITIVPVNDVPVAVNDAVTTNEDTPVSGTVTGNDTPSGDGGNVWSVVTTTTHGTLVFNTNGTYTYTPNANYNGTDVFTYKVCDVDGDCSTATVTITIVPVNDVPVAVNDAVSTNEDTPVSGTVTGNDTPSGDGGNVWSVVSTTTHGTLVFNPNGTYTYTPNANYNGTDVFTYKVCDVDGDCSTATVTITIVPVNDVPVAVNDAVTTNEDTPVSGTVTGNDTPSGDGGNVWSVVTTTTHGTLVFNPNGTYTYTPNANYNGTDVFTYKVCDVDGDCSTATVTITIVPVNDVPVAVNDAVTTNEDTPVSGTVTGNDTPSGDGGNVWSVVSTTTHGTLVFNTNGTYTYTPNANYNGTDVFTYKVCDVDGDCSTATVTITIVPVNDVPVAVNDAVTTNEDTPVSGTVTGNDTPSGDGGNVWSVVTTTTHGTLVFNTNGTYTYTPNANYNGTDVFTYKVCDVDGDCSTATVTITIVPVNDVPVAVNDAVTTNEDTPVSGTVTGNDTPSGDGGNVWSVVTTTTHGTLVFNTNGTYTYTPNANYNGTDVFTYKVCDVDGDCSTATVTITIVPVNDVPVAVNDAVTTNEDTPVSGTVTGNDTPSGDGGNVWSVVSTTTHGTLVFNTNGTYTYTPNANYNGTDVFTYKVCDVDGDCSTATVTITIVPVNDVPVAVNDAVTTNEDTPVSGTVTGNDTPSGDGGNVWTVTVNPTHGSVTMNPDGTYTYTPNANFHGTDVFTYKLCDANNDCVTATVTITIVSVDDPGFVRTKDKTIYVDPSGHASITVGDIDDGSYDPDGIATMTVDKYNYDCSNVGHPYTVTLTITDVNGNVSTGTATVTVLDIIPPVIVCPAPVTVQCSSAVPAVNIASVTATDNCSAVISHVSDVISAQTAPNKYIITRTYKAVDPSGNFSTCTHIITVNDNIAPTLIVANSLPGNSTGQCLAGVPGAPSTTTIAALYTDNCTGAVTAVLSNTTTTGSNATGWIRKYYYTVTDASGNTTTACVTYSGRDTQAPVPTTATLPTITGQCTASVTPPTATDNCAGTITATTLNPTSYSAQGTYTITWTYSDGNGNTSTQTQTVIVKDVTPPVITCPSTITVVANTTVSAQAGANVSYTVTATDNCGVPTITYSKASGTFFPVGTTAVTATANDGNGNTSSCTFNVVVTCVTPTIVCPANITTNTATGLCNAVVSYTPTITNGTPAGTVTYTLSGATTGSGAGTGSGTTFNKGTTTVTITATNLCGTVTRSFTVTVVDNENPIIVNLPSNISKTNDAGVCGAVVTWSTVTATDNCPGVTLTTNHVSGETYPVGTTTVTYTATDAGGRSVNGSFTVTVTDTQKPTVVCPSDIVVTANTTSAGNAGYNATYSVTATDNCGVQSITYSKASGSFFPIGTTPVTVTVTDVNGNTQTCTFNVVVNCVTPTIVCPSNISVNTATGLCNAVVGYTPVITYGLPTASVSYTLSGATTGSGAGTGSGATFNKGVTTVTITATNLCGTVSRSFTVTVNDTQAPVIACPGNITLACGLPATPANAGTATATDNCGGSVTITYTDAVSGNVTTRTWKATDAAGNFSTCTQTITVGGPFTSSIASVKTSNVYTGANVPSTTLFIGYGAQSTTLQTSVPAGTYTYTWSGASVSMLSSTTSANPVFTPTAGGNYTFNVTVTNALGCTSTSTIAICVTDIRVFASANNNNNCGHQSHNSYNCPHQGHGHSCSHQSHGSSNCPDGSNGSSSNNSCGHQSHSSYNCPHQGHNHSCGHQSHSSSYCPDKDDDDDHQTMCNHQSHSSYDCAHKGHNHECSHRSHSSYSCSHRGTNDRDDDDEKDCNHQSHSSSDCSHRGHNHSSCNHQSHSSYNCSHHKNNTTQQTVCNHQSHSSNDCNHNGHNHNTCNHQSHSSSNCVHNNNGSNGGCDDDDEDDDKKVYICHVPPGNTGNPQTLSISVNAVASHLANHPGDRLGSCSQTPCTGYTDTEKPVIDCADNKTVAYGSSTLPTATGSPEADDNSGDVVITYSDVSTKGTNAATASFYNYTITRTWKAADLSGNFSTCPQIITVTETVKPVITCPAAIIVACGSTAPAVTGTATATDNASPVTITYTDAVSGNTTTRTWKATDVAGNYATCTQTITVTDNVKPVISDVADITVNCGSSTAPSATGTATATDNCSTPVVTYSDVTGTNTITRTWKATDASGNYSTSTQVINIVDLVKPTITVPANLTVSCGASTAPSSCGGSATGTDNCSSVTVSYTDVTSGNVITRTWKTTDASGNSTTGVQTITIIDNVKPVISDVSDITISCGTSTTPSGCGSVATATDNCSTPVVTYTDVLGTNKITRTWKATDAAGNFATSTQVITIVDNTKPVLTDPNDITVSCGSSTLPAVTGNATATDNCSAVTISYTDATSGNKITRTWKATDAAGNFITGIQVITISDAVSPVITDPANITVSCGASTLPAATGTATATDNCSTPTVTYSDVTSGNTITRTWKATDAAGNFSTSSQTITILDNVKPTITAPANSTISCGASTVPSSCGGSATGTDACSSVTITYTDVTSGNTITRTWKATDASGNFNTAIQTITIVDNVKPVISDVSDITVSCGSSTTPSGCGSVATATDNCSTPVVTYSDVTSGNKITRTWKATDAAGNFSTSVQVITISDNTKPVITDVADKTVNCGASTLPAATGTATATDNCSTPTVTYTDVTSGNVITRTWKATDAAGNYSTSTQTITVGSSFTASLTSVPSSSTYTGGVSTNLYIGYGAQTTTLQMCSLPAAGAPYTYAWSGSYNNKLSSTTSAAPLFTPTTFGYYTFTVTVTNKFGCTSVATISICVTDIRVAGTSGSGAKVYMCHTPSGYNKTPQTIQVLVSQVPSHLSASSCGSDGNDKLGSCGQSACNTNVVNSIVGNTLNATKEGGEIVATSEEELKVTAMPNPSTTYFTLKLESKYETPVNMRVMDGRGRVIDARSKIGANSTIQIGHNYSSGTYYAEMTQGTQRKVVQLIKGRG